MLKKSKYIKIYDILTYGLCVYYYIQKAKNFAERTVQQTWPSEQNPQILTPQLHSCIDIVSQDFIIPRSVVNF